MKIKSERLSCRLIVSIKVAKNDYSLKDGLFGLDNLNHSYIIVYIYILDKPQILVQ